MAGTSIIEVLGIKLSVPWKSSRHCEMPQDDGGAAFFMAEPTGAVFDEKGASNVVPVIIVASDWKIDYTRNG